MKGLVSTLVLVVLVIAAIWVERRAMICGAGFLSLPFPHGIQARWWNGGVWLTDKDGWGVVSPPGDLELRDGQVLRVERIEGYSLERGVIAEVSLENGDHALITFEGSTRGTSRPILVAPPGSSHVRAIQDDPSWRSVTPRSCFHGRFTAARVLVAAGFAGFLSFVWRKRIFRRSK